MVGTRKRKSTSDDEAGMTAMENDPKYQALMRELHTDALPKLKGEVVEKEEDKNAQTYRHRGSIYLKDANTKEEWLQQEPERHRKKRRTESAGSIEASKSNGDTKKPANNESSTIKATDNNKRPRTLDGATEDAEEQVEERPAKRARRNSGMYNINYSRPRDLSDFTPGRRKARERRQSPTPTPTKPKRKDRMASSRLPEYSAGQDTMSCIEAARKEAEQKGWTKEPIAVEHIRHRSNAMKRHTSGLTLELIEVSYEINDKTKEKNRIRQQLEKKGILPITGKRKSRYEEDVASGTNTIKKPRITAPTQDQAAVESTETDTTQTHTPPSHPVDPSSIPTPPTVVDAEDSEVEIIAERTERHDSGASLTAVDSLISNQTMQPATHLPAAAKGGQPLRWSLSDRLNEVGRAEEAINKSKMSGESASARRRRVRREFRLVESWAVDDDGSGAEEDRLA